MGKIKEWFQQPLERYRKKEKIIDNYSKYIKKHGLDDKIDELDVEIDDPEEFWAVLLETLINCGEYHLREDYCRLKGIEVEQLGLTLPEWHDMANLPDLQEFQSPTYQTTQDLVSDLVSKIESGYHNPTNLRNFLTKVTQTQLWHKIDQKAIYSQINTLEALKALKRALIEDEALNRKWWLRGLDKQIDYLEKTAAIAEKEVQLAKHRYEKAEYEDKTQKLKEPKKETPTSRDEQEEAVENTKKIYRIKLEELKSKKEVLDYYFNERKKNEGTFPPEEAKQRNRALEHVMIDLGLL